MRWRARNFLLIALLALAISCGDSEREAQLPGTPLDRRASPDFRLRDQNGADVSLASLQGQVVVLTFLYTSCPDICPLTAEKLRQTLEHLGGDAARVATLAVSVDPERDTPEAARAFTERHRLSGRNWHYLLGEHEELEPVWSAYGIGIIPRYPVHAGGPLDAVGHTDALYVIDRMGKQRSLVRGDFDPAALADGIRSLLK